MAFSASFASPVPREDMEEASKREDSGKFASEIFCACHEENLHLT